MDDIRISVRLSEEEHSKFKIISAKRKTSMQNILKSYILEQIEDDEEQSNV